MPTPVGLGNFNILMKSILLPFIGWLLFTLAPFEKKAATYLVNTDQSTVHWTGYYLFSFGEHNGSIRISKGELTASDDQLLSGNFEIDMTSIQDLDMPKDDGAKDLEEHLKSDDFFSISKFPTANFEITKAEKIKHDVGQPNYEVTGIMTLKGTKNTVIFPAFVSISNNTVTAKAKFKFDRTKWDIRYNSGKFFSDIGDGAISDAIGIELNLQATVKP